MKQERVSVDIADRSYEIVIGCATLGDSSAYGSLVGRSAMLVTNETLAPLFGERVRRVLEGEGRRVHTVILPDGEEHKDWPALQRILDALVAAGCDRDTVLYALGGGVVGDIAGFAAACYMRGIRFVQLPTTLLAQVDSSVGGKTGINHASGKNLIGAFHQPSRVVIDLDALDTLPQRQLVAGLAEVIKYGAVYDDEFLGWIESRLEALLQRDKHALAHAVRRSCEIKALVVAADERESGLRAILNFGHTFAHAIETGVGYGRWLHGEAVGCGMVLAADLSARLGMVEPALVERLTRIVEAAGLPTVAPNLGAERYLELMRLDKKSQDGKLRFVLLQSAGEAVVRSADPARVAETIAARSTDREFEPIAN